MCGPKSILATLLLLVVSIHGWVEKEEVMEVAVENEQPAMARVAGGGEFLFVNSGVGEGFKIPSQFRMEALLLDESGRASGSILSAAMSENLEDSYLYHVRCMAIVGSKTYVGTLLGRLGEKHPRRDSREDHPDRRRLNFEGQCDPTGNRELGQGSKGSKSSKGSKGSKGLPPCSEWPEFRTLQEATEDQEAVRGTPAVFCLDDESQSIAVEIPLDFDDETCEGFEEFASEIDFEHNEIHTGGFKVEL